MKRQLKFEFENDKYVIKENDSVVFSIDGKDLKFVSLDFYNGIYKDKSAAIADVQERFHHKTDSHFARQQRRALTNLFHRNSVVYGR